jgi:undecaprenyl-diphosphatase
MNRYQGSSLVMRLDARDRALFLRVALDATSRRGRWFWTVITHLGGATVVLLASTLPLLAGGRWAAGALLALKTVLVSHLAVQLVKRSVGRPRPSRGVLCSSLVAEPDRFSFPSGHSAAAMSVALGYAIAFPSLAIPLCWAALVVGASRVVLAVHYPGDVLMGQLLAAIAAVGVSLAG